MGWFACGRMGAREKERAEYLKMMAICQDTLLHSRAWQLVIRTPNQSDSRNFNELESWIPAQRQWSEKVQVVVEWWTESDGWRETDNRAWEVTVAGQGCGTKGEAVCQAWKMANVGEVAGYSRPEYEEYLHGQRRRCVHFILSDTYRRGIRP